MCVFVCVCVLTGCREKTQPVSLAEGLIVGEDGERAVVSPQAAGGENHVDGTG